MIYFEKENRKVLLIKVTAMMGDDLWILSDLSDLLTTISPTSKEKALRYLTPENGWTKKEGVPIVSFTDV